MLNWTVLGVALVIPTMVTVGSGVTRAAFGLPQSAAADLVLAVVVFDATVIVQQHEFTPFVWGGIASHLTTIYVCMLIINLFAWPISAIKLESQLTNEFDFHTRHYKKRPFKAIFYSYLICVGALVSNTLPFT